MALKLKLASRAVTTGVHVSCLRRDQTQGTAHEEATQKQVERKMQSEYRGEKGAGREENMVHAIPSSGENG